MNFAIDANKKQTSMSGLLVIALHIAIICGLLYGLKPAAVTILTKDGFDYIPPPVALPQLKPPVPIPQVPKMQSPVMPLVFAPNVPATSESLIVTERVNDDIPSGSIVKGSSEQGTAPVGQVDSNSAPVTVGAVVDAKSCEKPEYPRNALRSEYTGVVTLALLIGLDGKVADSRIEKSSGYKELDQAARAGLSLCKFKPATLNGQPQKTWAKIQYVWSLDS